MGVQDAKWNAVNTANDLKNSYQQYEEMLKGMYMRLLSNPANSMIFGMGMDPTAVSMMQGGVQDQLFADVPGLSGLSMYDLALGTGDYRNPSALLKRIGFGNNSGNRSGNNSGT